MNLQDLLVTVSEMFFDLIIVELVHNQAIRHCGLGSVHFSKIVDSSSIRVLLFDVLVCEAHDLVAVRIDNFLDIIREVDLNHATHIGYLSFVVFFYFASSKSAFISFHPISQDPGAIHIPIFS